MRRTPIRFGLILTVLALLLSAVSVPAHAESESDGGYFDFFSDGGKIGNRFVTWIWQPHYFPEGIEYQVFLLCFREDADRNLTGNNKVTIKNIAFLGADTGSLLELRKQSRKLNKFHNNGYLIVNVPELALLSNESFVIAEVQFQIKGNADFADQVKCSADITEQTPGLAASQVKAKPRPSRTLVEILRDLPSKQ